ncbi:MAG: hypothetical protein HRF45_02195 [Fimbriimonadia bacterium]|jgi:peptidoglycan/xylan/chitin deacetylase (PgdA/CDA1 family)
MPTVAITVDCEAANENRCFTPEIVKIAEEFMVPITWLIYVSEKVPTANADLYYREYLHRIPSWHEIGMHVHFENQSGYVEDERERGAIIRMAKDVLKSHLIKPTSFRAGCFALQPSDIKYLEDVGVLVDSSPVPDSEYKLFVDWTGAPHQPYHPDPDDVRKPGPSKLLCIPVSIGKNQPAFTDKPDSIADVVENQAQADKVIVLGAHDYASQVDVLRDAVAALRVKGAKFRTLTDIGSDHVL